MLFETGYGGDDDDTGATGIELLYTQEIEEESGPTGIELLLVMHGVVELAGRGGGTELLLFAQALEDETG